MFFLDFPDVLYLYVLLDSRLGGGCRKVRGALVIGVLHEDVVGFGAVFGRSLCAGRCGKVSVVDR